MVSFSPNTRPLRIFVSGGDTPDITKSLIEDKVSGKPGSEIFELHGSLARNLDLDDSKEPAELWKMFSKSEFSDKFLSTLKASMSQEVESLDFAENMNDRELQMKIYEELLLTTNEDPFFGDLRKNLSDNLVNFVEDLLEKNKPDEAQKAFELMIGFGIPEDIEEMLNLQSKFGMDLDFGESDVA